VEKGELRILSKRFFGAAMMAAMAAVPVLAACSSDNPLCCTEFEVGATLDASIGGSAESQVAAQAVADIGGIASAAIDDLTTACRGMAQDLGAAQADQDAAEANTDKGKKMGAWCQLAITAIGTVKGQAQATITLEVTPPVCEASISAKADCQAKCSGGAKCDIKANPPTCTGGTLSIDCKGGCTGSAGASVSCTGSCTGKCSGTCTAKGGVAVDCDGKCEGTCSAGGSANGTGIQADGTCKGTCSAKCTASATAPAVKCEGSCEGKCDATCQGSANASVKCDGKCDADYQPLSCSGGKLEGGCKVEAKCDANCDASVSAKAECKPPAIKLTIAASASADANLVGKLQATLEANLPIIFGLKAKLEGIGQATASFSGNISAVADIKAACIPVMIGAAATALDQVTLSAKASGDVVASVK